MFAETFKSFTINFDALNERNTVSSGDLISGKIIFEISKKISISSLTLIAKGKAKVAWSRGTKKNRRHYSARQEYFRLSSEHIGQYNAVGASETVLEKGQHVYPFSIQLPHGNFPSSFQGVHGRVMYSLEVQIHRPWHLAKKFQIDMNFVSHIDANHPQLLVPLQASNSKNLCCLCCASGPISMNVRLERKGYVPGEMIKILAEFENSSSRTLVPKATLVQTQTCYTINRVSRTSSYKEIAKIDGRPVTPYTSGVWGDQMLQIPIHTPLTVSNCQILEVEYSLLMSLHIPRGHNLEVIFPLVICSIPVYYPPA
ncbi:hypothetical protein AGOR_G00049670 [Albula goreensis]|uniref:Arrestin C-terminal-like domain-containing protein n=1 Tax=Albula goreensis TaxID=1534307 RepID=A0A8T3DU12_9TELE|nr:hypothetical protein AGOR_G00049670 [Albula goreensis]